MPLIHDGVTINQVIVDGEVMDEVYHDGVLVWSGHVSAFGSMATVLGGNYIAIYDSPNVDVYEINPATGVWAKVYTKSVGTAFYSMTYSPTRNVMVLGRWFNSAGSLHTFDVSNPTNIPAALHVTSVGSSVIPASIDFVGGSDIALVNTFGSGASLRRYTLDNNHKFIATGGTVSIPAGSNRVCKLTSTSVAVHEANGTSGWLRKYDLSAGSWIWAGSAISLQYQLVGLTFSGVDGYITTLAANDVFRRYRLFGSITLDATLNPAGDIIRLPVGLTRYSVAATIGGKLRRISLSGSDINPY